MEPDRFQHNHQHYIIGIICLVLGLALFAFSIYMLPFLAFDWHYTMPDFIVSWRTWFEDNYQASETAASWLVFLVLFIPAIVLILVADILSNRIDNQIYGIKPKAVTKNVTHYSDRRESKSLIFRIIVIIIFVFIAAEFFQWAITITST